MSVSLKNPTNEFFSALKPLPVKDVSHASDGISVSAESVTFITGAAGLARTVALDKNPVMNKRGDAVGSFWRQSRNLVDGTAYLSYNRVGEPIVSSLTETAGAAAVAISNSIDMEVLFETPSGVRDFVIVVQDYIGNMLYGWIGGIATSGSTYTLSIFSTPSGSTQDWNGSTSSFDNTKIMMYGIYRYDTSFSWVTGTVLTAEVAYDPNRSDEDQLRTFSNGNFAIDYFKGRILYKKATTGTSDTCNYTTRGNIVVVTTSSGSTATSMQAKGTEDASGTDAYTTILTPTAAATHAYISLGVANDAIVSFDGGTTEHMTIPASSVVVLDNLTIAASIAIQGKNKTAGSNYTNLNISVW